MASIRWKAKCKKKPKYAVQQHNRCELCGRSRGYYRKFRVCRCCLRLYASRGEVPGMRKASW
jgi:small subunit ribosomal protein S14